MDGSFWMVEEFINAVEDELENLKVESNATATFLIDKDGQLIGNSKTVVPMIKLPLRSYCQVCCCHGGACKFTLGRKPREVFPIFIFHWKGPNWNPWFHY